MVTAAPALKLPKNSSSIFTSKVGVKVTVKLAVRVAVVPWVQVI